jgi:hypothetical protein
VCQGKSGYFGQEVRGGPYCKTGAGSESLNRPGPLVSDRHRDENDIEETRRTI